MTPNGRSRAGGNGSDKRWMRPSMPTASTPSAAIADASGTRAGGPVRPVGRSASTTMAKLGVREPSPASHAHAITARVVSATPAIGATSARSAWRPAMRRW